MVNRVILLGNVGQDPDVKMMPSGSKVVNLSIATSENWRDKDGNKQVRTEWHRVTVYNENLIKIIEQYVRKGAQLYIEGSIRTRKYTDNSGIEKYSTDIVVQGYNDTIKMIGSSRNSDDSGNSYVDNAEKPSLTAASNDSIDDDIPF